MIAIFGRLRFLSIPSQTHDLAWDCSIMRSMGSRSRDCSMPKTATHSLIAFFAGYFRRRNPLISTLIFLLVLLQVFPAYAWVFPEHRDIAVLAVQRLDSDRQVQLQALWSEARSGHEGRLCAQIADPAQVPGPACIDFAAWAAISGDHSCSAHEMLDTSLNASWVLGVARVAGRLKAQLAAASRRSERDNAVRNSDLALERTDPEYLTRASTNNAHFLLARPDINMDPEATFGTICERSTERVRSLAARCPLKRTQMQCGRRSPMKPSLCTFWRTASRQAMWQATGAGQPCARERMTFTTSAALR